jgi:hypothetical protein
MTGTGAASAYPAAPLRPGSTIAAIPALALAAYATFADAGATLVVAGVVAMAAWSLLAFHYPRAVIAASFPIILLAGTKFRMRDPNASLAGALDAQVLLELALYALVGAGVCAAWLSAADRRRMTWVEGILAGYAGIALASTMWSVAPALTLVRAAQLAVIGGLAIVSVRLLDTEGALWTACRAVTVFVVLCAASAVALPWATSLEMFEDPNRFAWFAVHPIDAGTLAAIGLLGMVAAALDRDAWRPARVLGVPSLLYAGVLLVVLVATHSRGPLLACLAGGGAMLLARASAPVRVPLVLAGVSGMLLYFVVGVDLRYALELAGRHDSAFTEVFFRSQDAGTLLELNGRLGLWQDLWPAIAANPLLGYGYQASRAVVLEAAWWAAYAHNALLQALLDLGVLGTGAILALIWAGMSGAARASLAPRTRITLAAIVVFLVVNSIATESFAGAPGIETLVLFVCALTATARDEGDWGPR